MSLAEKYGYIPQEKEIAATIQSIASNLDNMSSPQVLKQCFGLMDLTSLHPQDTVASVQKFVDKVNGLAEAYPSYPKPASICVFPNYCGTVFERRNSPEVHVTAATGAFPSSQNFLDVKVLECEKCVEAGADEIDILLPLGHFFAEDYEAAKAEIVAMKAAIDAAGAKQGRKIVLKVILETGVLCTATRIAEASFLAMEAGADFIKTSTGKVDVNATPLAAFVMCECIRKYYEATGRKVGFKAAGGISNAKDALSYYFIVSTVLGREWICPEFFRLGVSRLGNSLMSAIEQQTVNYF